MLAVLVNWRASPWAGEKPALICTVAPVRVVLSPSDGVRFGGIGVAGSFSVKVRAPSGWVSAGASLTGVMVMPRVTVLLCRAPSLTWKPIVRDVVGLSEPLR